MIPSAISLLCKIRVLAKKIRVEGDKGDGKLRRILKEKTRRCSTNCRKVRRTKMKKVPERKSRRQTDQIGALLRTLRSTEKHLLGVRVLKSKIVPKKTAVSKAREI